jgi:hypothetical protein
VDLLRSADRAAAGSGRSRRVLPERVDDYVALRASPVAVRVSHATHAWSPNGS